MVLSDEVNEDLYSMEAPNESKWRAIAESYAERWSFPNCVGAVDRKHVRTVAPSV